MSQQRGTIDVRAPYRLVGVRLPTGEYRLFERGERCWLPTIPYYVLPFPFQHNWLNMLTNIELE